MDGSVNRSDYAGGGIIVERSDAIARIIFNRPERMNSMTLAMWEALASITKALADETNVRVVTFEGAGGRAFVSGADITEFGMIRADPDSATRYNRAVHDALGGIAALPVPSLALVEGYCIGGGLEIALSCDLRLASETAVFAITPARLGLGFSYDGVALIERVAGARAAADLLFTARKVPAQEAKDLGLCERVFAADTFAVSSRAEAQTIMENAPLTIRAIKAALIELRRADAERDRTTVDRLVAICAESDDYSEGRAAFAEKRKPSFRGR